MLEASDLNMRLVKTLTAVLITLNLIANSVRADVLEDVVLGNGEWEPFQSKKLKHGGVVSRVVYEAFANQGVDVEFAFYPWKRSYELARRGQIAGTFVWSKKPERLEHFLFSDIVMRDLPVLFFLSDSPPKHWEPGNWSSISGLRVGAVIGYSYLANFANYESEGALKVERVASDELNFRKLLAKRIDVYPASLEAGFGILRNHFTDEEIRRIAYLPQMPTDYEGTGFHLIVGKNYPSAKRIIELFNLGLRNLKEAGLYTQYFEESRAGLYRNE